MTKEPMKPYMDPTEPEWALFSILDGRENTGLLQRAKNWLRERNPEDKAAIALLNRLRDEIIDEQERDPDTFRAVRTIWLINHTWNGEKWVPKV